MANNRVQLWDGTQAVLVRVRNYTPVYCHTLGRAVPYAVQIFDKHWNIVAICSLDGASISNEILLPLDLANNVPEDIAEVFAMWGQKNYKASR